MNFGPNANDGNDQHIHWSEVLFLANVNIWLWWKANKWYFTCSLSFEVGNLFKSVIRSNAWILISSHFLFFFSWKKRVQNDKIRTPLFPYRTGNYLWTWDVDSIHIGLNSVSFNSIEFPNFIRDKWKTNIERESDQEDYSNRTKNTARWFGTHHYIAITTDNNSNVSFQRDEPSTHLKGGRSFDIELNRVACSDVHVCAIAFACVQHMQIEN